jgi:hypothetical protein
MPRGEHQRRPRAAAAIVVAGLCLLGGCRTVQPAAPPLVGSDAAAGLAPWNSPHVVFPERFDRGYTLVLPGVQVVPGVGCAASIEHGIVVGLRDANVQSAVELLDWTGGTLQPVYNLQDLEHCRAQAEKVAAKILLYQSQFPGRPVYLIGYSGGGIVAVRALEALPPDHKVASAILLAPTMAYDYNLELALSRTEQGICSFYSRLDALILMAAIVGTAEGQHKVAAGAVGFQAPKSLDATQQHAYQTRLLQQEYSVGMLWDGHCGGHMGWANSTFVARHVAPLVDRGLAGGLPGGQVRL